MLFGRCWIVFFLCFVARQPAQNVFIVIGYIHTSYIFNITHIDEDDDDDDDARRFVERVLNSPQTRCQSQSNRWVLRCRANARGESVAVRRAAGRLFQMCGPVVNLDSI